MRFGGLIVAAGQSSRMGEFKPFMELNGFSMLEMSIQSMRNAGIDPLCVVVGRNADELESLISYKKGIVVRNPDYAKTDMLFSVRLGLMELQKSAIDAVFILPGDLPLVSPNTFRVLKEGAKAKDASVLLPTHQGVKGHPILIKRDCFSDILEGGSDEGLRGLIKDKNSVSLEVFDEGINLDADYPEDYTVLVKKARQYKGMSRELCEELYDEVDLPIQIREHCRAVSDLATYATKTLIACGYCLDIELCRSGAALHDILRLQKNHEQAGADLLESKGYQALASIVRGHQSMFKRGDGKIIPAIRLDEHSIVMLADKLVSETRRVSLDERYEIALRRFPANTSIGADIRKDLEYCKALLVRYEEVTHEPL